MEPSTPMNFARPYGVRLRWMNIVALAISATNVFAACATNTSIPPPGPEDAPSRRIMTVPIGYHHLMVIMPSAEGGNSVNTVYVLDWGSVQRPTEVSSIGAVDAVRFAQGDRDLILSVNDPSRSWTFSVRDEMFQNHSGSEFPLVGISKFNNGSGFDLNILLSGSSNSAFVLLGLARRGGPTGPGPNNCCSGGPGSTSCSQTNGSTSCSITCSAGYYACCLCGGEGCSCEKSQ